MDVTLGSALMDAVVWFVAFAASGLAAYAIRVAENKWKFDVNEKEIASWVRRAIIAAEQVVEDKIKRGAEVINSSLEKRKIAAGLIQAAAKMAGKKLTDQQILGLVESEVYLLNQAGVLVKKSVEAVEEAPDAEEAG